MLGKLRRPDAADVRAEQRHCRFHRGHRRVALLPARAGGIHAHAVQRLRVGEAGARVAACGASPLRAGDRGRLRAHTKGLGAPSICPSTSTSSSSGSTGTTPVSYRALVRIPGPRRCDRLAPRDRAPGRALSKLIRAHDPGEQGVLTRCCDLNGYPISPIHRHPWRGPQRMDANGRGPRPQAQLIIYGTSLPCWSWTEHSEQWSGKNRTTGVNIQVASRRAPRLGVQPHPLQDS